MNNIFKMLFILFLTIGYANATDIEFNSWSGDAGSFYITNATDKIITFNILNATINNQYALINASGDVLTSTSAESSNVELIISNIPDGNYSIVSYDPPNIIINSLNESVIELNVTNVFLKTLTFELYNKDLAKRYTLRDINNTYIASDYNINPTISAAGLSNGTYYIFAESVGYTVVDEHDYILTKILNITYTPKYVGEAANLSYYTNESYVFISMDSNGANASAFSNDTHIFITDNIDDLSSDKYYNMRATRKPVITKDITYATAAISIAGAAMYLYRKRRR